MGFLPLIAPAAILALTALLILLPDATALRKRAALAVGGFVVSGCCLAWAWLRPPQEPTPAWPLVLDGYALLFAALFLLAGLLAVVLASGGTPMHRAGAYYAPVLVAASGMVVAASSVELVALFVSVEVAFVALYALAAMAGPREVARKYFVMGALSDSLFLYGASLTFGATGSTYLSEIGAWLKEGGARHDPFALAGLALMLAWFAFKVGAFPFWGGAAGFYREGPSAVAAFVAACAPVAGLAVITRVLLAAFSPAPASGWPITLAVLAALTMTCGNVTALALSTFRRWDVRWMLAYSTLAQGGCVMAALARADLYGVRAVFFHAAAYATWAMGAFGLLLAMERRGGARADVDEAGAYTALFRRDPLLGAAAVVLLLSPGRFYIFHGPFSAGETWVIVLDVVVVVNAVIALCYCLRLALRVLERDGGRDVAPLSPPREAATAVVLLLAAVAAVMALWPSSVLRLVDRLVF